MNIDFRVLELACSRLCHDVISPIGAVNNGLELIEEEDDSSLKAEALALAQKSARRASVLLQVFRAAFGNAGNSASFGPREAMILAGDYFRGSKASLAGNDPAESLVFPAGFGKLLLNVVLLAGEAMPRGGRIAVQTKPPASSSVPIEVTATGTQILWTPDMAKAVDGSIAIEELSAQTVLSYLVHVVARRQECDVMVRVGADPASILLRIARR